MNYQLVLFDIDGTILLTAGAGRRAITLALREHLGAATDFGQLRFDGKTDPQIIIELLSVAGDLGPHSQGQLDALCARYLALLEQELVATHGQTLVLPGIVELLARLHAHPPVVLGLLTGNLAAGAELKLRSAKLDPDQFRVGAFGSDSPHRSDLPAIAVERATSLFGRMPTGEEIVIIGDTPADVTCGEAVGARAIAVATGSYSLEALAQAGPYAVFDDLRDTERVMDVIFS